MKTSRLFRLAALGAVSLALLAVASPAQAWDDWDWSWDDCDCGYQPTQYVPYTPDFYQGGYVPASQPRYTPANYTGYIPATRPQYVPADTSQYVPASRPAYSPADYLSYEPAPRPQYVPADYLAYEPAARTAFYTPPGYQPFTPLTSERDGFEPLNTNADTDASAADAAAGTTTLVVTPAGEEKHVATVHPNSNPDGAFSNGTQPATTVFGATEVSASPDIVNVDGAESTAPGTTFLSRIFSIFGTSDTGSEESTGISTVSGIAIFFLALIPALIAGVAIANRAREEEILSRYATFSWSDTDDEDEAVEHP